MNALQQVRMPQGQAFTERLGSSKYCNLIIDAWKTASCWNYLHLLTRFKLDGPEWHNFEFWFCTGSYRLKSILVLFTEAKANRLILGHEHSCHGVLTSPASSSCSTWPSRHSWATRGKLTLADQMIEVAKLSLYASWQQFRSIAVWLNCVFYTVYRFYVIWELLLHHSVQVHTLLRSISVRDFICRQATRIPNCSPLKAVSTKIVKIKRVCRKSTPKNGSVIQCKKHFSCLAEPHLALTLPGEASAWNYAVVLHVAATVPHWINIRICLPCLPASKLGTS